MSFAAKSRYKNTLQIPKKLLNFNKLLKKTLLTKRIFKNSAIRFLNLKKNKGKKRRKKTRNKLSD